MKLYLKTKLDEIDYQGEASLAELQELISIINTEISNRYFEEEFTMAFTRYYLEHVKFVESALVDKNLFYEIKNEAIINLRTYIDQIKIKYRQIAYEEKEDYKKEENLVDYITLQIENKYISYFLNIETINRGFSKHARIGEFIIISKTYNYEKCAIVGSISFGGYRNDKLPEHMQNEIMLAISELGNQMIEN